MPVLSQQAQRLLLPVQPGSILRKGLLCHTTKCGGSSRNGSHVQLNYKKPNFRETVTTLGLEAGFFFFPVIARCFVRFWVIGSVEMNTGTSGVRLKQEVAQAVIILHGCE